MPSHRGAVRVYKRRTDLEALATLFDGYRRPTSRRLISRRGAAATADAANPAACSNQDGREIPPVWATLSSFSSSSMQRRGFLNDLMWPQRRAARRWHALLQAAREHAERTHQGVGATARDNYAAQALYEPGWNDEVFCPSYTLPRASLGDSREGPTWQAPASTSALCLSGPAYPDDGAYQRAKFTQPPPPPRPAAHAARDWDQGQVSRAPSITRGGNVRPGFLAVFGSGALDALAESRLGACSVTRFLAGFGSRSSSPAMERGPRTHQARAPAAPPLARLAVRGRSSRGQLAWAERRRP
jgi:hypothetical protein